MKQLQSIHHVAIICSDYARSKKFYTEVLGLTIRAEHYRAERQSWKLDLDLNGHYCLELFSFPDSPPRGSYPEHTGLRHLAFSVDDLDAVIVDLNRLGFLAEAIRTDPYTGKRFSFIADPDGLPIEFYES